MPDKMLKTFLKKSYKYLIGKNIYDLEDTVHISLKEAEVLENFKSPEDIKHCLVMRHNTTIHKLKVFDDVVFGEILVTDLNGEILAHLKNNLYDSRHSVFECSFYYNNKSYMLTTTGIYEIVPVFDFNFN